MVNSNLNALFGQVSSGTEVKASADVLIVGLVQRMQAAVTRSITLGARESELLPIQDEIDSWRAASARFAEAIVANTPDVRWAASRTYPKTAAEKRFEAENAQTSPFPPYDTPVEGRPSDRLLETAKQEAERKAKTLDGLSSAEIAADRKAAIDGNVRWADDKFPVKPVTAAKAAKKA